MKISICISQYKVEQSIERFFKKHGKKIKFALVLACFLFNTGFTSQYQELDPLLNLLKFFIDLVRYCSAVIGGAIATISGWNIMINTNGQGIKTAKSNLSNALIGLVLVFFGSTMASFLIDKLIKILS